ncbi:glycosyltransferase [Pseudochelatococcus sp. B33]
MHPGHMDEGGTVVPELAFLCRHGVEPAALALALQWARHWQVPVVDAILALQLIPEDAFYRALAQELDIPYLPDDARVAEAACYPAALTARTLPLAPNGHGLRIAIAPDGPAIEMLLRHRHLFARAGVALVSPGRLAALARRRFRREIAEDATMGLAAHKPGFSYRDGPTGRQIKALGAVLAVCAGGAVLAPLALLQFFMLAAGAVFLTMSLLRLVCLVEQRKPEPAFPVRAVSDAELPVYTVIVPLFQEARVVPQLLHALVTLDYPPAKLDIKLVLEADDRLTRDAIEAWRPPGHIRILTVPEGMPRTKPRALNAALATARGSHVVIYDAEDIPDPQQLRKAAGLFVAFPDVACLQARIVIDNPADGFIASMFTIEYAALFDTINPGLAAAGLPLLLGGTSNHLRTQVLREIGGWDAWNVTEDADLGIRLARMGYSVMDLPSITREEAPFRWRAWLDQRARWMKGWMQVCITHSRHPLETWRDLGTIGFAAAATLTLGTVLGALCMPLFVSISVWMLATTYGTATTWLHAIGLGFSLTVLLCGALAFLLPVVVGLARRRRLWLLWLLPLSPLYFLLLTIAAWFGLCDLIVNPSHWRKTRHGLSRRRWHVPFR